MADYHRIIGRIFTTGRSDWLAVSSPDRAIIGAPSENTVLLCVARKSRLLGVVGQSLRKRDNRITRSKILELSICIGKIPSFGLNEFGDMIRFSLLVYSRD